MTLQISQRGRVLRALAIVVLSASLVAGCGGGGGGGNGGTTGATTGTISGNATKGPVNGATVTAYAVSNGARGAQLGHAQTTSSGDFTIIVPPYSGPMMLQAHGGSYSDEATGLRMNMLDADDMTCVVPAVNVTAGSTMTGIQITPLTSMAQAWAQGMAGGMNDANVAMANSRVGMAYLAGADILMTHPMDPSVVGSANGASIESKYYGMMLAAMSQEARDLGMTTSSSAMVTAMVRDASDGTMDGMMGGNAIRMTGMGGMMGGGNMMSTAATSQLAITMAEFINDLSLNRSGVTSASEMQALMDHLNQWAASGGHL